MYGVFSIISIMISLANVGTGPNSFGRGKNPIGQFVAKYSRIIFCATVNVSSLYYSYKMNLKPFLNVFGSTISV